MSLLIHRSSPKEDIEEEEAQWWVSEASATHPSGLIRPSRFSHCARRSNSLQPRRGYCCFQFIHSFSGVGAQNTATCSEHLCAACILFRSSQTECRSMRRAPSIQWASVAHGCLPAWRTLISSVSTPARSRMVEQVLRCTPKHTLWFVCFFYHLVNSRVDCNFQFEIVPEDDPQNAIVASSARTCYANLLKVTASSRYPTKHGPPFLNVFRKLIQPCVHNLAPSRQHPSYRQERTSLAFHTQPSRTSSRVVLERANAASKCAPHWIWISN